MVAECVERLDEVLSEPEVFLQSEFFWLFEDMSHLQGDGFNKAFRVLGEIAVFRRRGPIVRSNLKHLLNLFQSLDTTSRIIAQDAGDSHCYVVR